MPNTITYSALSHVLPQQRLSMYEKVFNTKNAVELHGAYIWSVKASASIQPLLSALEVALRNSIHINATNAISKDWYDKLSTRIRKGWKNEKRDIKNIEWHKKQVADIKKKLSHKTPPKGLTMHDLLVAKMDFGFWDNLLRECFSINGNSNALWPQCIPDVFPNLPKGQTNSTIQLKISALRDFRNDLAHNSPVWKGKGVIDEQTAIKCVNSQTDKIVEIIGWLSAEKIDWLEVHMQQSEVRRIISKDFLYLCQRKEMDDLQQKFSRYKRELRSNLKSLDKDEFDIISTSQKDLYMITKVSL